MNAPSIRTALQEYVEPRSIRVFRVLNEEGREDFAKMLAENAGHWGDWRYLYNALLTAIS